MTNENVQNDENPQEHQRISKYFIKMITNLCQSRQLGQFFSAHISENNSFVLEDVCTNIIKSQLLMNRFQKMERSMQSAGSSRDMKQALQILGLLAKHQTARNMISRMKIIDDLNGRMCRLIEQPRKDAINADSLQQLYWVIQFYVQLSQFKDTNSKIMMDKRILQAFISILTSEKFTFHLLQKETLHLMQNLACFKQSKSVFLSNKQIHKVNLYLLEQSFRNRDSIGGQQQNQVSKSILKMIYNLIYKSSAALKIYKRSQVIQLITLCCQAIRCSDQTDGIFNQLKQCLLQALNQ